MWPPKLSRRRSFTPHLVRRAEDVAVEIELAGAHFAGEMHDLREQPHHVAVAGMDDVGDAVLPAERGVGFEMRRLAVDRHQRLRLQPVVEPLQFLAARVAGGVDQPVASA